MARVAAVFTVTTGDRGTSADASARHLPSSSVVAAAGVANRTAKKITVYRMAANVAEVRQTCKLALRDRLFCDYRFTISPTFAVSS